MTTSRPAGRTIAIKYQPMLPLLLISVCSLLHVQTAHVDFWNSASAVLDHVVDRSPE